MTESYLRSIVCQGATIRIIYRMFEDDFAKKLAYFFLFSTDIGFNFQAGFSMMKSRIYLILFAMLLSISCNKDATIVGTEPATPDTQTASVYVSSPNGGEDLKAQVATSITWSTVNVTNKLHIEISTNAGVSWQTIADTVANSGKYAWTPGDAFVADSCLIRISDMTNSKVTDISNNFFRILKNVKKALALTAPNGGDSLTAGQTFTITWQSSNILHLKLQYSTDAGASWLLINSAAPAAAQSYVWTVPKTVSSRCRVKISDTATVDTISAFSVANFKIVTLQNVAISSPIASEILYVGASYEIRWIASYIANVRIELSTNNGVNWSDIVSSTPNDSSYIMTIPNATSDLCKLRISDASDATTYAVTSYTFSIQNPVVPTLYVTKPAGGDSIVAGSSYSIKWTSSAPGKAVKIRKAVLDEVQSRPVAMKANATQFVKIEFSTNSGSTWKTLAGATQNTGTWIWSVDTTVNSSNCRIRVSDTTTGGPTSTSSNFTVYIPQPKTITVESPKGGEAWEAGTVKVISWTSTGLTNLKLEYTSDGGNTFTTIANSVTASNKSYNWTVPNTPSTLCMVRISSTDGSVKALSSSNFSITPAQSITIVKPNGGESLTAGGSYDITWSSSNITDVSIDYTTNNGVSWLPVVASTPANGFYTWSPLPNINATNCRIRIADARDGSPIAQSEKTFSILAPLTIRVIAPNGGEKILSGSSTTISWVTSGGSVTRLAKKGRNLVADSPNDNPGIPNVKIEFTTNGGTSWDTIVTSTPNNGSYIWNPVPNRNSGICRVRVSNAVSGIPNDVSDSVFSIQNQVFQSITVNAPNGGESFAAGGSTNITWTNTGIEAVSIDYTTDNGTNWNSVVKNIPGNGIYQWSPIPSISSTNCKIRIYDALDSIPLVESKNTFTIVPQPSVTVLTPAGGENLTSGTVHNITWTAQSISKVKIELTVNNGSDWTTIADSVISNGVYAWTVPNLFSTQCKIRISNYQGGNPYDVSKNVFTITNQLTQTVKVLKPNGGEVWTAGTTQSITWANSGIDSVKIDMTTDNGVHWSTVVARTPGSGIYNWLVPSTVSTNCKIRISDATDGLPSATSDSTFSITARPTINVVSPNGGERVASGGTYNIQWTFTSQAINDVKIELSTDGGVTFTQSVTASTPNSGSYVWNPVPVVTSPSCRIRVSDVLNSSVSDISDSNFVITVQATQTISLTAPNGGESLTAGGSFPITWTSSGVNQVSIDYSTDGNSWTNIVRNIPTNGYYLWTSIPNISSTNCKVRVYDAVDSIPSAQSANQFTILSAPTLTVLAPNGGESLTSGSPYTIRWNATSIVAVKIEFSNNGGGSWVTVADSTPSTGLYVWTVPVENSNNCKIRISNRSTGVPSDVSDNVFSISSQAVQTVKVTSPNGGETWTAGTSQNITWAASGIDTVAIAYSSNNGISWNTVAAKVPSNGFYTWQNLPQINSTQCLIKVGAVSGQPFDKSDTVFTIQVPAKLKVTAPNGGEHILAGTSYTILWSTLQGAPARAGKTNLIKNAMQKASIPANGNEFPEKATNAIASVRLEFSTDGGDNWTGITNNVANTGSFVWNPVPNISTSLARIRVSDVLDASNNDISDSNFVIYNQVQKSITVNTPNGGESVSAGSSFNITWTSVSVTSVSIQFSTNNGVSWSTIASAIPSSGFYTWNPVPNVSSTNCKIRVLNSADTLLYDESNAPFTILPQPTISVLTPNGGEQLQSGNLYNITWTAQAIGKVKIELTVNNGADWSVITDSVTSTGSYSWLVPNITSSLLCKIRISNSTTGNPSDVSDNVFAISNQLPQSVKVLAPNGGEKWEAGIVQSIVWASSGIDTVKIEMTTNNGVNWSTVINKTPSNGIYNWSVPATVSTNCKIRVSDASDGTPADASDSSFTISPQPTIRVVTPNGGERILSGSSYTLQWTSTGSIANVRIELSTDGGATYATTIVQSTTNNGSYTWDPVPAIVSSQCRIRISDIQSLAVNDISDSNFVLTILAAQTISVTAPNGGESLIAGSSSPITWTSSGVSSVGIDYSTNNGVAWTNIVSNIPSNGYYLWNPIPAVSSTNCKVRIYDALDTLPVAQSTNQFTILPAPSISVISPNGGEQLISGTVKNILWTSSNILTVKIQLTTNSGASWVTVIDSTPSNGSYAWTVPALSSNLCKIKISERTAGSPSAQSASTFTVIPSLPQTVTMLSPNGGESLAPGTSYPIKWVSSGIDTVKIELTSNNGVSWTTVVAKTASNGVYIWSPVPAISSTNCKIRVSDAVDGDPFGESAAVFSVLAQPSLKLTAPNGGERILAGSTYTIAWNTNFARKAIVKRSVVDTKGGKQPDSPLDISNVKLELSSDEGINWTPIIQSTPNVGTFVWNPVANINSALCRIRVSDASGTTASDISDSNFIIYNQVAQSINVKTPNGTEVLTAGGAYDITWNSVSVTAVTIELSTNNGVNWSSIANNVASTGFYHWSPIPNVSSTNCKVRISDAVDSLPYALSNSTFSILPSPSVSVLAPIGGENLIGGQEFTILWNSANIATVRIKLTTNNGASWVTAADSVESKGTYTWTVPSVNSNLCKIRIEERATGNPAAESNNTFTIATQAPQSITITAPNGGEKFPSGTTQSITWTSTSIDTVKIEFSTDNGVNWQTIVNKTPSTGFYSWSPVPAYSSTNCKVRISSAATGNPFAMSANVFTIAPQPAIKVIVPKGGEVWITGSTQTIQWSSTNLTAVRLEFTTNNGASWTTIADSAASTGLYTWTIPDLTSTLCKVRVSNPAGGLPYSISDTNFTISNQVQESLVVTSPSGGETWEATSSHNITWTASAIKKVKIEFTTDNGLSWTTITDSVANTGLYQWNPIPNTPSTLCKVRISKVAAGTPLSDVSKATFTINPQRKLTIVFPNGGENLTAGTSYQITWTSSGVSAVNILYVIGNSGDTTTIVSGAPNSGTYSWSPSKPASGYKIIITDGNQSLPAVTESVGSFTVLPEPSITVLAPNHDVQLPGGSTYDIRWQSINMSAVKIELTTDNGAKWQSIVDSIPSTGIYTWLVPNINSALCRIRISNQAGGLPSKLSDSTFTIYSLQTKKVTVTAPNGGEKYPIGTSQVITWTSAGIDSVKIEYSIDGITWNTIVSTTPSTGFYSWYPVPNALSTNCIVRISNVNSGSPVDQSDSSFSIIPQGSISVIAPRGGEIFISGTTENIRWSSQNIPNVTIEYSSNNGSTWNAIVSNIPSTGLYSWTNIPVVNSNQCRVKVKDAVNGVPYDTSGKNFSIVQSKQLRVVFPDSSADIISQDTTFLWYSVGVSKVNLDLSLDNGLTWSSLAANITSSGAYSYAMVPGVVSSLARFRVTDAADPTLYDMSNGTFVLGFKPPARVRSVTPAAGGAYNVTWSAGPGKKILQYSADDGKTWVDIEENVFPEGETERTTIYRSAVKQTGLKFRVLDKESGKLSEEKRLE